jgi:hypothetical protein
MAFSFATIRCFAVIRQTMKALAVIIAWEPEGNKEL